jgi:hypothetical protein
MAVIKFPKQQIIRHTSFFHTSYPLHFRRRGGRMKGERPKIEVHSLFMTNNGNGVQFIHDMGDNSM